MLLLGYTTGRMPSNANREMARINSTDDGPRYVAYACRYYDGMITGARTPPDVNIALNGVQIPRGHIVSFADESGMFAHGRGSYVMVTARRSRHYARTHADFAPRVRSGWVTDDTFRRASERHSRERQMRARLDGSIESGDAFVPGDNYHLSARLDDDTGRIYANDNGQRRALIGRAGSTALEWAAYVRVYTRTFPTRSYNAFAEWESTDGYRNDGFTYAGWDREGYGRTGLHRHTGRDRDGYDISGYDEYGHDRRNECGPHCKCGVISGYHVTPRDWVLPTNWTKRFLFGVELELHTTGDTDQRRVVKTAPKRGKAPMYLITERDGSLGEYGVETVGPPLPLEAFLGAGKVKGHTNPWPSYLASIRDVVTVPTDGYGMHVNISRCPLGTVTNWEKRFLDSINTATRLVQFVAGRNANTWANFTNGRDRYYENGHKYRVANVKRDVIEIRLFKAHPDMARMRANVQFCDALLRYTKRGGVLSAESDDHTFIEWVRARPRKYGDLIALLDSYVDYVASGYKAKPFACYDDRNPDDLDSDDDDDYDNDDDNDSDDDDDDDDDDDN